MTQARDDVGREASGIADTWIPKLAEAIRKRDIKAFSEPFDPELEDEFDELDFLEAIEEEQDGLGYLENYSYLGHVKRNPNEYPGQVRFVYSGKFTQSEGLVIVSVRDRDGGPYFTEHVYYWD